ncbi:hypothetical protein CYMTET_28897, partial [Cymbomonas tetramitiformis]
GVLWRRMLIGGFVCVRGVLLRLTLIGALIAGSGLSKNFIKSKLKSAAASQERANDDVELHQVQTFVDTDPDLLSNADSASCDGAVSNGQARELPSS